MARVKTTARAYRLGCGCVSEFASLPAVSTAPVVCGTCGDRTVVAFRYPDSCCAASCRTDSPAGGVVKVRCTLSKQHTENHYDESVSVNFEMPAKIRAKREGNT